MRTWTIALAALVTAACGNPNDKPPQDPSSPMAQAHTTSGALGDVVGGEGYGGTTDYGSTHASQGQDATPTVDAGAAHP